MKAKNLKYRFYYSLCLVLSVLSVSSEVKSETFDAPKFGVKAEIPKEWPIFLREKDDRVFVAIVPQADPDRPGVAACELALAPEGLDEYRTRIDTNAKRGEGRGKLVRNEVVKDPKTGVERLESVWEFRPREDDLWHELKYRLIANRQLYTFILNVEDATYAKARTAFEDLLRSVVFSPPNTGADAVAGQPNRWVQREFKFELDLPEGWKPSLAPNEIALFYANGPAHGIWADNVLVIAQPSRPQDLPRLAKELPERLRVEDENCEVLSCKVVKQGKLDALETVVRTRRGPFSMTILERRFKGERFNYETKYTVESKRFDALAPTLRQSLDSFAEIEGEVPALKPGKAA
jgi:hypothetical protein